MGFTTDSLVKLYVVLGIAAEQSPAWLGPFKTLEPSRRLRHRCPADRQSGNEGCQGDR
jgi:hypothetical protein